MEERLLNREVKVVLLPYVAFGHLIPFYHLAKALAKNGIHVYYISTPRNISRLPEVPPDLKPLLSLVPIAFPKIPNSPLPEDAEATTDTPNELIPHLDMAYDLLQQPFKQFVADNSPDWLIVDFRPHWAVDVAEELGVPLISFSAFSAAANVKIGPLESLTAAAAKKDRLLPEHFTSTPPWVSFPSKVAHRRFEAIQTINWFFGADDSSSEDLSPAVRLAKVLRGAKAIAIRTCREVEGDYVDLYAKLMGKSVIPVGFLPPQNPPEVLDEKWKNTFAWLDEKRPKSVVFVGFGSECKLSKEQVFEIANGVEQSELSFIWILRKPMWAAEEADALPPGFLDRTGGRGKVCIGWAPQFQILAHPAVKVCLFHCAWGSLIETLQFGHALVVLPIIYEQGLNSRLMVEKGLAIEVDRDDDDGSFTGKDIAMCLKQAMATEESDRDESVRRASAGASNKDVQERYMDDFVKYLVENKVQSNEK